MTAVTIGAKAVSSRDPAFVIAEIGVNHDGSLARALELVTHARNAGANAVKLQVFDADRLMSDSAELAQYQMKSACDPKQMLRALSLTPGEIAGVVAEIEQLGMVALATPFSLADVDVVEALRLPAIKIASPDLVNLPLLRRCAKLRKPLLLSTGASTMEEVARTARWVQTMDAQFALLHCVSSYPARLSDANLSWIAELGRLGVVAGYSDHTSEVIAGALAVAHGACIVEKHLTYDRNAAGPDHAASADPVEFREYVRLIRQAETARGTSGKRVLDCENDVRRVSRQSLAAARDLSLGDVLHESDLMTMRPGIGICASRIDDMVGRKLQRPIRRGQLLDETHLSTAKQHAA